MDDLRSNLAKVKGLGSSKSGVEHWWHQRLSAIIIALFLGWLLYLISDIAKQDLSGVILILQKPYNVVLLGVMIFATLYHGMLGIQVIIEDYVSCIGLRHLLIMLMKIITMVTIFSFIVALFYMMKI